MNILDFEWIKNDLIQVLTKKRYEHTLGVAYTACSLAMRYSENLEDAFLAGLLHDRAKCINGTELLKECLNNNISVSDYERQIPYLLHAKVGAFYAKSKYNIHNENILNAIAFHTTGRPNMSILEKIIYIADFIEPNRMKVSNLDEIRKIAFEDIDECIYIISNSIINYLKSTNALIDTSSIETFEYYKLTRQQKEKLSHGK